jgi:hypothetical protein
MRRPTDDTLHYGHQHFRFRRARLLLPKVVASSFVLAVASFSAAILPAQVAGAATDMVTNCSGSATDPGSLPDVIQSAGTGDTVTFSVSCPPSLPIVLADTVDIPVNLDIDGPGSSSVAVSGNGASTVFAVPSGVTAAISGITIEDGLSSGGSGIDNSGTLTLTASTISNNSSSSHGGGIFNNDGTVTVNDSTLSGNSAYHGGGGGIDNDGGSLTVLDSTLSDNDAFYGGHSIGGGGLENDNGTVSVTDSTFSHNSADYGAGGGGGIFNNDGTVTLTASTLAQNIATHQGGGIVNDSGIVDVAGSIIANSKSGDCFGTIVDAGYNLDDDGSCGFSAMNNSASDVDPYLGPLQNNGGPTETRAPALDSPVLDQIPVGATGNSTTLCPGTDQRGVARPQGSECDIGAVELSPTSQTITSADSAATSVGASFSFTVTTSGVPTPVLKKSGNMPKHLKFMDNGNGTATISGKPKTVGTTHITIKAIFGSGGSKFVVTQEFTINIDA